MTSKPTPEPTVAPVKLQLTYEELVKILPELLAAQQRIAELTTQLAKARQTAIEECAKVAEEHIGGYSHIGPLHAAGWTGAAEAISKRIRALAQPAKGDGYEQTDQTLLYR